MALVRTCRTAVRGGGHYVPGGASCAASGRRPPFAPTFLRLSSTLKMALSSPVVRLSGGPA